MPKGRFTHGITMLRTILAAGAIALATSTSYAAVRGTVTTDLNLRAGPSSSTEVLTTIPGTAEVLIERCLENRNWCEVSYDGATGYAYGDYLLADLNGERVVVRENLGPLGIAVGAFTGTVETVGDAAGALVRGTADTIANVIDPPEERLVYVRENPVDPVFFEQEVAIGVGLPETVVVREVPGYEYGYAYVNGQPVFVEPSSRRVVYIVR